MKLKKLDLFKLFVAIFLACGILAVFVYVCIKGDLKNNILSWSCVIACFVLSLLLVNYKSSLPFVTLGLAANAAADYFLLYNIASSNDNYIMIGLYIFCGVQFCYFLYTLSLNKTIAGKVVNMAMRAAVCLILYFVMNQYYVLGVKEIVALVYIGNLFVTFIELLFHFKTEWLLALGMFVLLASNCVLGLVLEGFALFGVTGKIVEFLILNNIAFYTYIPALVLIALGSVLRFKKKKV